MNANNEKLLRDLASLLITVGQLCSKLVTKVMAFGIVLAVIGAAGWTLGAGGGLFRMGFVMVLSCVLFLVLVNFASGWLTARRAADEAGH